jgi:hypothetical protein
LPSSTTRSHAVRGNENTKVENLARGFRCAVTNIYSTNKNRRAKIHLPFTNNRQTPFQHPRNKISTSIFNRQIERNSLSVDAISSIPPKVTAIIGRQPNTAALKLNYQEQ